MSTERPCPACAAPTTSPRCTACGAALSVRDYTVDGLLYLSPYSRVYKARSADGTTVALKELVFGVAPNVKVVDRFEREGRVLRELDHPRIPKFFDAFTHGEGPDLRLYLAQAFVAGENLESRMAIHRFDEDEARRIAKDVLEVLAYLHGRSPVLVHRDVKPANVIAQADGGAVLVDFGAVRDLASSQPVSNAGTFEYMPPEQLAGEVDGRADLYALGATLIHLLSRRNVAEMRNHDLDLVFRPYVNVSEPFADFLEKLVARSVRDRYPTARRALTVLTDLPREEVEPPPAALNQTRINVVFEELKQQSQAAVPPQVHWLSAREQLQLEKGRPWVLVIEGQAFGLRAGGSYVIGRGADADVRIRESWTRADTVSRRHARIALLGDGVRIDDLGSTNGTRVGAIPLLDHKIHMKVRQHTRIWFGKLPAELMPWWPR